MEEFIREVKEMSTADIMLILEDQLDLYSEEEIRILKEELISRPENALELEEKERERIEEIHFREEEKKQEIERQKRNIEIERKNRERIQQEYNHKIDNLSKMGLDGYYEYKVISLFDESGLFRKKSGALDTIAMTQTLNDLGIEGWHLVTAYSNELGKNALSGGVGGVMLGVNSTVDENILIFERFVRINKE